MSFSTKEEHSQNVEWTELKWMNRAHGLTLPYRSDFVNLDGDFQFLLQRDEEGVAVMRRAGLFLEALFGQTLAGRNFSKLFSAESQEFTKHQISEMFDGPSKIYIQSLTMESEVEFGLFPVSSDYGPVEYALGAVSLERIPKQVVTQLELKKIEKFSLQKPQQELKYGFAEDSVGFAGAPRARFEVIQGGGMGGANINPELQVIYNVKREP